MRVKGLLALLVCVLLSLAPPVSASRAVIDTDALLIPRVDVEGLGALELLFQVTFEGDYYFDQVQVSEASLSTSNAATFDGLTMTLEIYEIELGNGDLYAATLGLHSLASGYRFRLLEASYPGNLNVGTEPSPDYKQADRLYSQHCAACHGPAGHGTRVGPSLIGCANCSSLGVLASYISATMPLGNPAACDADCATELGHYVLEIFNEPVQQAATGTQSLLETLSAVNTVHKASMKLVSRLPAVELQIAADDTDSGLRKVLVAMMSEDSFYRRLSAIFNAYLLTDKYHSQNGSEAAVRLLDRNDFPAARWFDPGEDLREEDYSINRQWTNDAIAREPLELINYVVRNELPFTVIVTADYLMVNPYSARS